MTLATGSTLEPFRVIESLGKRGKASIYTADLVKPDRHISLRLLSLRLLPQESLHNDSFGTRYEPKALAGAKLVKTFTLDPNRLESVRAGSPVSPLGRTTTRGRNRPDRIPSRWLV